MRRLLGRLFPFLSPGPPHDLRWLTADIAQSEHFNDGQSAALPKIGIRAILDLRSEQRHGLAPLGQAGLHYLHMAIEPNATPTAAELGRAAGWVRDEQDDERKVLIHCSRRSTAAATLIAAALVRCGEPLDQALAATDSDNLHESQLDVLTHYATRIGR